MVLVTKQKRQHISTTHKKRYGQHRKQTKPYLQTYWPYLPLLIIVGTGLLANSLLSHHSAVLGYASDISTPSLLIDTNAERNQNHEQPLRLSDQLDTAAQTKANDMVNDNYWSHISPAGQTPWVFIQQAGYDYQSAGENLAYGFTSSSTTLAAWMNSPDHRANILSFNYQDVGFGIANSSNYLGQGPETIVVAMYGQPVGINATASPYTSTPTSTVLGAITSSITTNSQSQSISRIQVATDGSAAWSMLAVSILATFGLVFIFVKHGLLWRRALVKGETFIIHHPWIDMTIVSLAMVSFVLSRSAGIIL